MTPQRIVSYGGGVQSTSLLVLAAQGRIDFRTFVFANVGDDSEHPATLAYIEQHAKPYAASHGIDLHVVDRVKRDGTVETLYGRLTKEGSRSLPIPVRMSNGAPGTRSCTQNFKIEVIGKWLKAHGASKDNKATVGIGISLDEIGRVNNRKAMPYENPVYPLLDLDPPPAPERLREPDPRRRPAGSAEVGVLVLPVPPAVHMGGDAARRARVVPAILRPGGAAQRASYDARQGPGVADPLQQAACRRHPKGGRDVRRLQPTRRSDLRQRDVLHMSRSRDARCLHPDQITEESTC